MCLISLLGVNINVETDFISNSFSAWDGGHTGSGLLVQLAQWLASSLAGS